MAAANRATPTIKSNLYHPQHLLAKYNYSEASTFSCAGCELIVSGSGYSCDECNFNIHERCFGNPGSISVAHHPHELTLTRLSANRWCNVCKETSHAGRYMYTCVACNYDVHPRCRSLVPQDERRAPNEGGRAGQAIKVSLKIIMFGFKVANALTGGIMSPVVDTIDSAIDGI